MGKTNKFVFSIVIIVAVLILINDIQYFIEIKMDEFNKTISKFFSAQTVKNYVEIENTRMLWLISWHIINILRHTYVMIYTEDPGMREEGAKYSLFKDFLKTSGFFIMKSPLLFVYKIANFINRESLKASLETVLSYDQLNTSSYLLTLMYFLSIYFVQLFFYPFFDVSYLCAPLFYLFSESLKIGVKVENFFSKTQDLSTLDTDKAKAIVKFVGEFMSDKDVNISNYKIMLIKHTEIFVCLNKATFGKMELFLSSKLMEKIESLNHIKALLKTEFFLKTSPDFKYVTKCCDYAFSFIILLSLIPRLYKRLGFPHTNSWYLKIAYFYSVIVPFEAVYSIVKNYKMHEIIKAADYKTASLSFEDKQSLEEALKIVGEQSLHHIYENRMFNLLRNVYPTIIERLENLSNK